jgi:hypothetical protein
VRPPDRNIDACGQVLFDTTYHHGRPATPYMAGLTGCLRPVGGGSWSHGDTWCPRSCPASGGGCWSPGDMWCPRSCPESGGESWSHGDTWHPRSCPEPGGGSRSRGDTWRPRRCPALGDGCWSPGNTWRLRSFPEPGGGYHSTAPSFVPFCGRSGRGTVLIRLPLPLPSRHPTQVAAPFHDFDDHDHLDIKGLSSACGTH